MNTFLTLSPYSTINAAPPTKTPRFTALNPSAADASDLAVALVLAADVADVATTAAEDADVTVAATTPALVVDTVALVLEAALELLLVLAGATSELPPGPEYHLRTKARQPSGTPSKNGFCSLTGHLLMQLKAGTEKMFL